MKMQLLFVIYYVLAFCSCSHEAILKKSYVLNEDSKRKLTLSFINDSVCFINNLYNTNENEFKQFEYRCRYSVKSGDYLLLTNSGDLVDTAGTGFFYFPFNYADSLIGKQAGNTVPNYSQQNYKYLKVPYVGNDTLIRYKRSIVWIKKDKSNRVVGYYKFKSN